MFIIPPDDDPILVSLPRDLWIPNPCTGGLTRINANLNGCGDRATGPELLSLAVEQYTGIRINHFALFDFEGFVEIVDRVGGVEICVDESVRTDWRAGDAVFAEGCTIADGEGALAWMRSRHTLVLNQNGVWVPKPGVNDFDRNQRQQDMLIQALEKLKSYRNITEFATVVEALAGTFTIDDDLSLWAAISLAWDQRDLNPAFIERPVIPTSFYATEAGAIVLVPTEPFQDVLATVYPNVDALLAHEDDE
jgi:LCP family protein required for cell wall assembly